MKARYIGFGLALGLCSQALAQLSPGNPLVGLEKLKDFEVTAFRADQFLDPSARERYQIRPDETVFLCRKPANAQ